MKKLVKFFTLVLTFALVVVLASCSKKPYNAEQMANAIQFENDKKTVVFQFALDKEAKRLHENGVDEQVAPITWTSDDARIEIKDYIVYLHYDETQTGPAVIKGTVEVDGVKASQEFKVRVGKENSYDEFVAANPKDSVAVSGYISQLGEFSTKYENFTLVVVSKDKEHSYYSYRTSCSAEFYETLQVGQLVALTGSKSFYNGPQIEKASIQVLAGDTFTETAIDLTADMCAKDKLTPFLNRAVKATDVVLTSAFDASRNSFEAEFAKTPEGTATKVKVEINKNFFEKGSPDQAALVAKLQECKPGDTIDVEGLLMMNNNTPIINLFDATKVTVKSSNPDFAGVKLSEAGIKAALDKADFKKAGEVVLPVEEGVTPEFTLSKETSAVALQGNKLVVNPTNVPVSVDLTVKLTKGNETITFVETLKVQLPVKRPEKIDTTATLKAVTTHTKLEDVTANYADKFEGLDPAVWTANITKLGGNFPNPPAINVKNGVTSLRLYSDKTTGKGNSLVLSQTAKDYNYVILTMEDNGNGTAATLLVNGVEFECPAKGEIVIKLDKAAKEITIKNATKGTTVQAWISKIELA